MYFLVLDCTFYREREMPLKFSFAVRAGLIISAVIAVAGTANAGLINGPISLNTLDGTTSSFLVGDKIFDNFTYTHTGDMPDSAHVNITPTITTLNGQTVWGFQVEGLFTDSNAAGNSTATLNYRVTVVDPTAFLISDAHLSGDTDVIGTGVVDVTETWTPNVGAQQVSIFDIEPGNITQLQDSKVFTVPAASIDVTKTITATIADGSIDSNATVTSIDQLYSQTPGSGGGTPEPASLGLLGLGALALLARRRR
jgi:hypothetical protein